MQHVGCRLQPICFDRSIRYIHPDSCLPLIYLSSQRVRCSDTSCVFNAIVHRLARSLSAHIERVSNRVAEHRRKAPSLDGQPFSIVRRLLEHLDLRDRIALSQTCSSLRAAAVCCAHVWAQIRVSPHIGGWWPLDDFFKPSKKAPKVWRGVHVLLARSDPVLARTSLLVDVSRTYTRLVKLITAAIQRSEELALDLCVGRWAIHQGVLLGRALENCGYDHFV